MALLLLLAAAASDTSTLLVNRTLHLDYTWGVGAYASGVGESGVVEFDATHHWKAYFASAPSEGATGTYSIFVNELPPSVIVQMVHARAGAKSSDGPNDGDDSKMTLSSYSGRPLEPGFFVEVSNTNAMSLARGEYKLADATAPGGRGRGGGKRKMGRGRGA